MGAAAWRLWASVIPAMLLHVSALLSNDCFYLYSDETLDPETGENIKGEFRDIYDRKK